MHSSLQWLAALNWLVFALGVLLIPVSWFLLSGTFHADGKLMVTAAILLVAVPFGYLGNALPERRGRVLQTLIALPLLFALPVGTIYGAFALYVCFGSADDDFAPPKTGPLPPVEPVNPLEAHDSPYGAAQAMLQRGQSREVIRAALEQRGLSADEVETVLGALR